MSPQKIKVILSVDPGKQGGVVLLDLNGHPIEWWEMSAWVTGSSYDCTALVLSMREIDETYAVLALVVEHQQSRPTNGSKAAFGLGSGFMMWRMIAACFGWRIFTPRPAKWQKVLADAPGGDTKARAIHLVRQRLPTLELTPGRCRKPKDGLADAGALGLWWLEIHGRSAR